MDRIKGNHLVVSHGLYQHHAIDMGDGRIIQYGRGNFESLKVEIVSLDSFPAEAVVHVRDGLAVFSADEIIERALSRIDEDNYCLYTNNCEHFVNWCRTGEASSRQVERVVERTASVSAKLTARLRAQAAVKYSTKFLSRRLAKSATPWLLAADVAQLGVEVVASGRGVNQGAAERAGQAVGLGASVGIGAIAGGPLGALAGAGFWIVGEVAGKMTAVPASQ